MRPIPRKLGWQAIVAHGVLFLDDDAMRPQNP